MEHLDLLATAPGGVGRLRELILTLAVQGKLVAQEAGDEPAGVLLQSIRTEKGRLIAEGKVKRDKPVDSVDVEEAPWQIPVGWQWVRMGSLVHGSEAGWSPSCEGGPRSAGRWGVLKVSAVSWGAFDANANKELPANLAPRPEYEVKDGDFLLSRANTEELVARSVVVGRADPRLMLSDKIIRLDVSRRVNRSFLNLCNNARHARSHYAANASGTSSSMKNVSREVVLNLPVPLPPLAEQSRIVARVEELMRLCDALEAKGRLEAAQHAQLVSTLLGSLTNCRTPEELAEHWQRVATHFDLLLDRPEAVDALEQTILQLAVRGLLVPQNAADEPASVLLQRIHREKDQCIASGLAKSEKLSGSAAPAARRCELPYGWIEVRLGSLALRGPSNGISPKPQELPTQVRCLSLSATTQGYFKPECFKYVDIAPNAAKPYRLKRGDLLIQRGNSMEYVGIAAVYDGEEDAYIFPDLMMRLQLTSHVNTAFVHMVLVSRDCRKYFQENATGTQGTMPKVNQATVAGCPIPLPPLAEQSRIVARVDSLRRLCADLRQRLTAAQATQSHLAEALMSQPAQ
jgi:type I restriction enzyme S subunit